jgi:hypothetical protein
MDLHNNRPLKEFTNKREHAEKTQRKHRIWIHPENMRLCLSSLIVVLFVSWIILGLIVFLHSGNSLLLLSISIFTYPLHKVLDYYFIKTRK